MLILITDHSARLESYGVQDAEVRAIAERTKPFLTDYENLYTHWRSTKNDYQGKTAHLKLMMKELSSQKISRWAALVRIHYPKQSAGYKSILGFGNKPLHNGAYEVRISFIESLVGCLAVHPQLSDLRDEVQIFHNEVQTVREHQQQKHSELIDAASNLDAKRIEVAQIMYANAGLLMNKFHNDTHHIESFFELKHIRAHHKRKDKKEE